MKAKIITIAVIVAAIALIVVGVKYLPLWSSLISAGVCACAFTGGWYAKKWWDGHVKGGRA